MQNAFKVLESGTQLYSVAKVNKIPRVWFLSEDDASKWLSEDSMLKVANLSKPITYIDKVVDMAVLRNPKAVAKRVVFVVNAPYNNRSTGEKLQLRGLGFSDVGLISQDILQDMGWIDNLPADAARLIAFELEPKDILSMCVVSTKLNNDICGSDRFWATKFSRDFPLDINDKPRRDSWHNYYKYAATIPRGWESRGVSHLVMDIRGYGEAAEHVAPIVAPWGHLIPFASNVFKSDEDLAHDEMAFSAELNPIITYYFKDNDGNFWHKSGFESDGVVTLDPKQLDRSAKIRDYGIMVYEPPIMITDPDRIRILNDKYIAPEYKGFAQTSLINQGVLAGFSGF